MNILKKIENAFNKHKVEEIENVYIPKIQSTVNSDPKSFNEVFENVKNELQPKQLDLWK